MIIETRMLVGILLFVVPVVLIALFFMINRSRGGTGRNWGAALFVGLCWLVGMMVVMRKLDQFL